MASLQTLDIGGRVAELGVVPAAAGLVLFCHPNGGNRTHQRSQHVARRLQHRGISTLLLDLLSADEAALPDALDRAATSAGDWFCTHLQRPH